MHTRDKAFARLFLTLALFSYPFLSSLAVDLAKTAETLWYDPRDTSKVAVKIEFFGIPPKEISEMLGAASGYTSQGERSGRGEYSINIQGLGNVIVRRNDSTGATEVITPPVSASNQEAMRMVQHVNDAILVHGGALHPKSKEATISVIREIRKPASENAAVVTVLNYLRNYAREKHEKQMAQGGMRPIEMSNDLRKKILDPTYSPSAEDLFADLIYREAMKERAPEVSRNSKSSKVRDLFLEMDNKRQRKVLENNPFKNLALTLLPFAGKQPVAKLLQDMTWDPMPGLESHFVNRWDTTRNIRVALGMGNVTEALGAVDHDRFLTEVSGLQRTFLKDLRKAQNGNTAGRPIVVRYLLTDPTLPPDKITIGSSSWSTELEPTYRGVTTGFLRNNERGTAPVQVGDNTVVWHTRTYNGSNLMGEFNPGLVNNLIAQVITDNKYVEAKFFEKYVPGAMAQTQILTDLIQPEADVVELARQLKEKFPKGWVVKGVQESATGLFFVSDKLDIVKEVEEYKKSDFDQYYEKMLVEMKGRDEDDLWSALQKHKNFRGWKIAQFLKSPGRAIVQERLPLVKEFRVQAISGRVIGGGASVDRHKYSGDDPEKFDSSSIEMIKKAEAYAQSVVDKLPKELRGTPFAFDIGLLSDGSFRVVESNPGPEDGFFHEYHPAYQALHRFLSNYPQMVKRGEVVSTGLDQKEQVERLHTLFKEWKIDPKVHLLRHTITDTKFEVEVPVSPVNRGNFIIVPTVCRRPFHLLASK